MESDESLKTRIGSVLIDNDLFKCSTSLELKLADTACSGPIVSPKRLTQIRRSTRQKLIQGTQTKSLEIFRSSPAEVLQNRSRRRHYSCIIEPRSCDSAPYLTLAVRSTIISIAAAQRNNKFAFSVVSSTSDNSLATCGRSELELKKGKNLSHDAIVATSVTESLVDRSSAFDECEIKTQTVAVPYVSSTPTEKCEELSTTIGATISEVMEDIVGGQLHTQSSDEVDYDQGCDTFTKLRTKARVKTIDAGEEQSVTGAAHEPSHADCQVYTTVPMSTAQCEFTPLSCLSTPRLSSTSSVDSCTSFSGSTVTSSVHITHSSSEHCEINTVGADTACQGTSLVIDTPKVNVIDTAKVKESSLGENDELSFSSPRAYRMRPGTLMVRKATRGPEDAVKNKILDEKALEDLYCNRLWKSQLPKERSWETIYEEPVFVAKTNSVKVQSVSRVKRLVNFSAEGVGPSPAKTKRRQQRARQYGWRAFSKKRLQDAETVLLNKIGRLDSELDCGEEEHSLATEPDGVLCYSDNVKVTEMKTKPTEI